MSTKVKQSVLRQESLRVTKDNLPDECREWYLHGKVKILILFFEELGRTGKVLKFAQFYRKYRANNRTEIPLKEFQHFMDEEMPAFGANTDHDRSELASKLFGSERDPQVENIIEAILEKEEAKVVQTKLDDHGNVVRVELYKNDHLNQNGHLNGHHDDQSPEPTDSGTGSDTQETTHSQSSTAQVNGGIKSSELDSLFGWDKTNGNAHTEPKQEYSDHTDNVNVHVNLDQNVHVQHVKHDNIELVDPKKEESQRSPTFGYTTQVGENPAPNWLPESYLQKHPQDEPSYENHVFESRTISEEADKVAHEAEKVSEDAASKPEVKSMTPEEEEAAERSAAAGRLWAGLNNSFGVQETWNFSGTSDAEMIAEADAIDQATNETTAEPEVTHEDVKELFNLERGAAEIGHGRFLAEEQQPLPETKIDISSFAAHFKEQEEAEAKTTKQVTEEEKKEMTMEDKQKASLQEELKVKLAKRNGEVDGVHEQHAQSPINVHVVVNATQNAGTSAVQQEVETKVVKEEEKITQASSQADVDVIEVIPDNETSPKQLHTDSATTNEASTSASATTTEGKVPKKVITLDELVRTLIVLYIKFLSAFDKIFETQPKAFEKSESLTKFHEDFQALVSQLMEIDEKKEAGTEEYNHEILKTILEFYNGPAFRKIYAYLTTDESEFCNAVYSIMEKTRKNTDDIATEYKNEDAQQLSVLMKERIESIEQIGKDDRTRVRDLFKNNATELANVESNLQRLVTTLNVVIRQHSKNDYISESRIHLDNFDKMQINQPGKLILLRDRVVLICDPKKGKSVTVFSTVLKDVKVQQVAKHSKNKGNVFSRMFSCQKDPLVSDDELEDKAAKDLLQVTQRTDNYRNTFRLQITPGQGSFSGDAKQFLDKFEKMSAFPDFKDMLFELDEHFKSTAEA